MIVTQRCALMVQLQPFMTHIPGLVASTMHGRNARYHRNTEHTIARSHLISPSRALNTLRLTLIATIPDRAVRSSPADQRRFVASFITIRSLALQRTNALARSGNPYRFIPSIGRHCARNYHPLVFFIRLQTSSTDRFRVRTEREVHLLPLSISNDPNDRHIALEETGGRLFRYARGRLVVEENEDEKEGQLRIQLTRS